MKYICFTNDCIIASSLDILNSVDTIFVDLEILGKFDRQGHTNGLISNHTFEDIKNLRNCLQSTCLGARIDPLNSNSEYQINKCIEYGVDVIMLPMFSTVEEVQKVISFINKRVSLDLLFETPASLEIIDFIPKESIRKIHFGINDLALAYSFKSMFNCLFFKGLENAAMKCMQKGYEFGIGGIGALGSKPINPELIFSKLIMMKSSRVILSRSFLKKIDTNNLNTARKTAKINLDALIALERKLMSLDEEQIKLKLDTFKKLI